jgi:hypothetical protein
MRYEELSEQSELYALATALAGALSNTQTVTFQEVELLPEQPHIFYISKFVVSHQPIRENLHVRLRLVTSIFVHIVCQKFICFFQEHLLKMFITASIILFIRVII